MRAAESRRDIASGHTAIPLLSEAPAPETRPPPPPAPAPVGRTDAEPEGEGGGGRPDGKGAAKAAGWQFGGRHRSTSASPSLRPRLRDRPDVEA